MGDSAYWPWSLEGWAPVPVLREGHIPSVSSWHLPECRPPFTLDVPEHPKAHRDEPQL